MIIDQPRCLDKKVGWTLAITEADVDVAREENVEGGGPEQSVGVGLD